MSYAQIRMGAQLGGSGLRRSRSAVAGLWPGMDGHGPHLFVLSRGLDSGLAEKKEGGGRQGVRKTSRA